MVGIEGDIVSQATSPNYEGGQYGFKFANEKSVYELVAVDKHFACQNENLVFSNNDSQCFQRCENRLKLTGRSGFQHQRNKLTFNISVSLWI
jgi:hypothetical protein